MSISITLCIFVHFSVYSNPIVVIHRVSGQRDRGNVYIHSPAFITNFRKRIINQHHKFRLVKNIDTRFSNMVTSILPLNDAPPTSEDVILRKFTRNRLIFSVIPLLFIALDSPQSLRFIASYFLTIVEWPEVQSSFRQLQNKVKSFEHMFRQQSEHHLGYQQEVIIPTFFKPHDLALSEAVATNLDVLIRHSQYDKNSTTALQTTVDFLRAWSKLGHDMHYKLTPAEQTIYEVKYGLGGNKNNSPLVIAIISNAQTLRTSLQHRIRYDEEYIANKTRGLAALVPAVTLSLDNTLLINDAIRKSVLASRNQLVSTFRALRQHYADLYERLTAQLTNAQVSLDVLANAYSELLEYSYRITAFISSIPIPSGRVMPTIELGNFPPGDFFKPDFSGFPALKSYLSLFDAFLLEFEASFDNLGDDLVSALYDVSKNGSDAILKQITKIAITTDYHPPGIELGNTSLTTIQAFEHLNTLEMDLFDEFQFGFNTTEPGDLLINVPPIDVPAQNLASDTVTALQSVVEYFDVAFPAVKISPLFREWFGKFFRVLSMLFVGKLGFVVVFAYRSMLQMFTYWDGSAILTPTVDMRTKAEQARESRLSRKTAAAVFVFESTIRGDLTTILQYIVISGLAVMLTFLVYNYEAQSFRPNCVESLRGTLLGQFTIAPLFYNRALVGSQSEVFRHNSALQLFAQDQCHLKTTTSLEAVKEQSKEYTTFQQLGTVRQNFANEIKEAQDLEALCRDFERKCGTFSDDCPKMEDGTTYESPCLLLPRIEMLDAPLEFPRINCSEIPVNVLKGKSRKEIEQELVVAESSCLLEGYLLSTYWMWAFMIFSWALLKDAVRPLLIGGLHIVLRHLLAPEEFKVNVTTFANGQFSEPEYGNICERKLAVQQRLFWLRFAGCIKVIVGFALLGGWIALLVFASTYKVL
jgi:hypothetical protein